VNSRLNNCVAVNNGWRNTEPTRFYMTGFYLSCGVTLKNCIAINNRNCGFWIWQSARDVVMNGCIDSGSDRSFQLRTGQGLRLENCFSKNARTYALYMWGSEGAVISNFQLINPKHPSGCIAIGLREDHPEEWWPVRGSTIQLVTSGADTDRLFQYYNGEGNRITVNGEGHLPIGLLPIPTVPTTVPTTIATTAQTTPVQTGGEPQPRIFPEVPGAFLAADYDDGGEGSAYHDTTTGNSGAFYRGDNVDIERSPTLNSPVVAYTRPGEWLAYTVNVTRAGVYEATIRVAAPEDGRSFSLSVDGVNFGQFAVPNTGSFDSYTSVRRLLWIGAGPHTLRIDTQGYHNIHTIQIYPPGGTPDVTAQPTTIATSVPVTTVPVTVVPSAATPSISPSATPTERPGRAVPAFIEAEDYELGGEGQGYHDTTPGNSGGYYRGDDVDIRYSAEAASGVVTAVESGEWLRYRLSVATPGIYTVNLSVGSARSGDVVEVCVDGTCMARVSVPATSDTRCQPVLGYVWLPAGSPVLELRFAGRPEIDAFALSLSGGPTPTPRTSVPTPTATTTATATAVPVTPSPTITCTPTPIPSATATTMVPTVTATILPSPTPSPTGPVMPTPTPVVKIELPGAFQAENWTRLGPAASSILRIAPPGVQGAAVSSRVDGAWTEYQVNSTRTGIVEAVIRLRPVSAGGKETGLVRLLVDDLVWANLTARGDSNVFVNVSRSMYLQTGTHRVRLETGRGIAVDYLSFQVPEATGDQGAAFVPTLTAASVPQSDPLPTSGMTSPATTSPVPSAVNASFAAPNVTEPLALAVDGAP